MIASPVIREGRLIGFYGVSIATRVERPLAPDGQRLLERLTLRERDVVRQAARGLTASQIGAALGIGRRTVESHLDHVRSKLGIRTRTELIVIALRSGLLQYELSS